MRTNVLIILCCLACCSCQKELIETTYVNTQEAKVSFITLICDHQNNPGCTGELGPAMGATIKLYTSEEDRDNKRDEVSTTYTDHEGHKTISVDPGYYYIYTLHKSREVYTEENAVNRTTSFHEVIIMEY